MVKRYQQNAPRASKSVVSPKASSSKSKLIWGLTLLGILIGIGLGTREVLNSMQRSRYEATCREGRVTGQWRQVSTAAEAWLKLDPSANEARLFAAEAKQEEGDYLASANYLDALDDRDPLTGQALLELALMDFGVLARPLHGEATLKRMIRIMPQHIEARRRLMGYYSLTWQHRHLFEQARMAISMSAETPAAYVYLVGADWVVHGSGENVNEQWAKANPDEPTFAVAALLHRIRNHEIKEEDGELKSEIDKQKLQKETQREVADALNRFPDQPALLNYVLDQALSEGSLELGAELLDHWPESERSDANFYRYKGWINALGGHSAEAESAFREGLKLNPYDWRARHLLADALRQQMHFDEAESQVQLGLKSIDIRRKVMQMQSLDQFDLEVMTSILDLAKSVGDMAIEKQLQNRIVNFREMQNQ